MNNNDERDHAEEAANARMLRDEYEGESVEQEQDRIERRAADAEENPFLPASDILGGADTQVTAWGETGTYRHDENGARIYDMTTCGTCHRTWNDALITSRTPAPAARCPFEADHPAAPVYPFLVKVSGMHDRIFRITPGDPFPEARNSAGDNDWFSPVDCRDLLTGAEAQSIVEDETAADAVLLVADEQTRDAIASAWRAASGTDLNLRFARFEIVKG